MQDADVLSYCRSLVAKAAAERDATQGAFVIRNGDGLLYFVPWPPSRSSLLRWRGRVPPGTVAIVHTHPPMRAVPSEFDAATAQRLGLPVYILTPLRIVKTTGDKTDVVKNGKW
ncbi:MAG: Mov34/MPN/PAD-1 family protein [Thermoanaerobaculia bacterium]